MKTGRILCGGVASISVILYALSVAPVHADSGEIFGLRLTVGYDKPPSPAQRATLIKTANELAKYLTPDDLRYFKIENLPACTDVLPTPAYVTESTKTGQ